MILYLVEWLLLYPASGYRAADVGRLNAVGTHGYCWSSVVSDATVYIVRFFSADVTPISVSPRANGYDVRCVQSLLLFSLCSLTLWENKIWVEVILYLV